ncbi:MAG: HAD-IIB family hydrolase [Lactovum sp.]
MEKLVCVDVDGTLIQGDFKVKDNIKQKMTKMKEKFVIVSGRTVDELKQLHMDCDLIGSNGGEIYVKGQYLQKLKVSKKDSLKILKDFEKLGYYLIVHTEKGRYIQKNSEQQVREELVGIIKGRQPDLSQEDFEKSMSHMMNHVYEKSIKVENLYDFVSSQELLINKLESHFEKDKTELFDYLSKNYEVEAFNSAGSNIEIVPKGAFKDLAIKKYIGNQDYKIIAIGDGNNDIPMFEISDYGIAMGNATLELKALAQSVVSDVAENGFLEALSIVESL